MQVADLVVVDAGDACDVEVDGRADRRLVDTRQATGVGPVHRHVERHAGPAENRSLIVTRSTSTTRWMAPVVSLSSMTTSPPAAVRSPAVEELPGRLDGGGVLGDGLRRHPRVEVRSVERVRHAARQLPIAAGVVLLHPVLDEPTTVPLVQADAAPRGEAVVMIGGGAVLAKAHAQAVPVEDELVHGEPESRVLLEDLR